MSSELANEVSLSSIPKDLKKAGYSLFQPGGLFGLLQGIPGVLGLGGKAQ